MAPSVLKVFVDDDGVRWELLGASSRRSTKSEPFDADRRAEQSILPLIAAQRALGDVLADLKPGDEKAAELDSCLGGIASVLGLNLYKALFDRDLSEVLLDSLENI